MEPKLHGTHLFFEFRRKLSVLDILNAWGIWLHIFYNNPGGRLSHPWESSDMYNCYWLFFYSFSHSMFLFAPLELRLKGNIFRPPVSWWTSCPLVKKRRLARSRKRKHQVSLRDRQVQGPTRDIWVYSKRVRKSRILWGHSKYARVSLKLKSIWNWSCLNLLIYILYFLDN